MQERPAGSECPAGRFAYVVCVKKSPPTEGKVSAGIQDNVLVMVPS